MLFLPPFRLDYQIIPQPRLITSGSQKTRIATLMINSHTTEPKMNNNNKYTKYNKI